jgi:hypothetical protein
VNDSARPGLLAALVAALFVVGVAGAAVHKDDEGRATRLASPTTSTTPSTAAALTTTSAAPVTTVAAPTTTVATTSTGSGLAASGAGRVVAGRSSMPNTGPPPLALPGGALLALALASRRTSRRARARG